MTAEAKIIGLKGTLTPNETDELIIAECEKLLAAARNGEVTALAIVTMNPQGLCHTKGVHGREKTATLLGMAMALVNDIDRDWHDK